MQHVLNVAFDFDDRSIREYVERDLKSDLLDRLAIDVKKSLGWDWELYAGEAIRRYLGDHMDEIMDLAVLTAAKRIDRRKAWRDALAEAREELGDV